MDVQLNLGRRTSFQRKLPRLFVRQLIRKDLRRQATANPEMSLFTKEFNPVVMTVIFSCERLTFASDISLFSLALPSANRWLPAAIDWSFLQTATFLFLQLQLLEVADLSYGQASRCR